MVELIFATNNEYKVKEIKNILRELYLADDCEIKSLNDIGLNNIEIKETFDTLEENAIKKAKEIYKVVHKSFPKAKVISEDFGFFIEELPNICGVKSNRWYKGTDEDRNNRVLKLMKDIENRKCYYKSVYSVYDGEIERVFSGYTYGTVALESKGTNGFSYDSIFMLDNNKTIAELEPEEKDEISSRREAFEYLIKTIIKEENKQ